MPGYPLFVAAVYGVFGENPRAVYLTQALLGGLIALLTYLAGKEIAGEQIAVVAAFLYALDPLSLFLAGSFQTEQLFTALTLAALCLFLRLIKPARHSLSTAVLFGFVAGLAALTRNVAGLMFIGLSFAVLTGLMQANLTKRLFIVVISCGAFAATLAPWMVRNYYLTGQFTLTTQTWQTLSMANNDSGGIYMTKEGLAAMPHTTIEQSEAEREAIYKNFLIRWIGEHPGEFLALCALRAVAFWSPLPTYVTGLAGLVAGSFNILLLTLALLYAFSQQSRSATLWPCYVAFATFTIGYSVALVATRFRLPLYPLVEIMSAGGALTLWNQVRPSRAAALRC
jgi:4-amino-4-deoxy-L-arabinose transferase-like glycosyltransferase